MKKNKLRKAYKRVFHDMLTSGCGLLIGEYDAANGDDKFMCGVSMVMDWVAYKVSDEAGDTFSDLFTKNMIKSKERAKNDRRRKA